MSARWLHQSAQADCPQCKAGACRKEAWHHGQPVCNGQCPGVRGVPHVWQYGYCTVPHPTEGVLS